MSPVWPPTFANTFLIVGKESDRPTVRTEVEPGFSARKKRAHHKSRNGCVSTRPAKLARLFFVSCRAACLIDVRFP